MASAKKKVQARTANLNVLGLKYTNAIENESQKLLFKNNYTSN